MIASHPFYVFLKFLSSMLTHVVFLSTEEYHLWPTISFNHLLYLSCIYWNPTGSPVTSYCCFESANPPLTEWKMLWDTFSSFFICNCLNAMGIFEGSQLHSFRQNVFLYLLELKAMYGWTGLLYSAGCTIPSPPAALKCSWSYYIDGVSREVTGDNSPLPIFCGCWFLATPQSVAEVRQVLENQINISLSRQGLQGQVRPFFRPSWYSGKKWTSFQIREAFRKSSI